MSGERRDSAAGNSSNKTRGRDEMIKVFTSLQDLRRRIYVEAKADKAWRFWGLDVHVCKKETLYEAYGDT